MKNVLVVVLMIMLFAGCSTVANIRTDDTVMDLQPTTAKAIKVYSTAKIGVPYSIIGEVVADADAGEQAAVSVDKLKIEAAKLGADAIINLRLEVDAGYLQNAIKATGTAVKIKQ